MKKVALAAQKGGSGKTTTAVNLAAALIRAERSVLLVDMDPQGSLTEYFLTRSARLEHTVYHLLMDTGPVQPVQLGERAALLPANIDLAAAEIQLPTKRNQERTLARRLQGYAFDYCLIDCPPSLGVLTTNALTAADVALVPAVTELMGERATKLILDTIEDIKTTELNPELRIWRILPTRYDQRRTHHKEILEALRTKHGALLYEHPVMERAVYNDAVANRSDVGELSRELGEYWDTLANRLITELEAR